MRFDSQGNLYLYEPGAGMSGEPKRVIEYGSDEVIYADGNVTSKSDEKKSAYNKFQTLSASLVHHVLPKKRHVITNFVDGKARHRNIFEDNYLCNVDVEGVNDLYFTVLPGVIMNNWIFMLCRGWLERIFLRKQ